MRGQSGNWLSYLDPPLINMSKAFISAVENHLPDVAIVFDRYHISALMNRAIEDLRREQQNQLDEDGKQVLKGTRFLLLKNYENLTEEEQKSATESS
ncbi:MAG: transposase [Deltaproteobacteria bacterium]|nr:transposase [Deltaproteobacteria bacterium]